MKPMEYEYYRLVNGKLEKGKIVNGKLEVIKDSKSAVKEN